MSIKPSYLVVTAFAAAIAVGALLVGLHAGKEVVAARKLALIKPGMSEDQVVAILGQPIYSALWGVGKNQEVEKQYRAFGVRDRISVYYERTTMKVTRAERIHIYTGSGEP